MEGLYSSEHDSLLTQVSKQVSDLKQKVEAQDVAIEANRQSAELNSRAITNDSIQSINRDTALGERISDQTRTQIEDKAYLVGEIERHHAEHAREIQDVNVRVDTVDRDRIAGEARIFEMTKEFQDQLGKDYQDVEELVTTHDGILDTTTWDSTEFTLDTDEYQFDWSMLAASQDWRLEIAQFFKQAEDLIKDKIAEVEDALDEAKKNSEDALENSDIDRILDELLGKVGSEFLDDALAGRLDDFAEQILEERKSRIDDILKESNIRIEEMRNLHNQISQESKERVDAIASEAETRGDQLIAEAEQRAKDIAAESAKWANQISKEITERNEALDKKAAELQQYIDKTVKELNDGYTKRFEQIESDGSKTLKALEAYKVSNNKAVAAITKSVELNAQNDAATLKKLDALQLEYNGNKATVAQQIKATSDANKATLNQLNTFKTEVSQKDKATGELIQSTKAEILKETNALSDQNKATVERLEKFQASYNDRNKAVDGKFVEVDGKFTTMSKSISDANGNITSTAQKLESQFKSDIAKSKSEVLTEVSTQTKNLDGKITNEARRIDGLNSSFKGLDADLKKNIEATATAQDTANTAVSANESLAQHVRNVQSQTLSRVGIRAIPSDNGLKDWVFLRAANRVSFVKDDAAMNGIMLQMGRNIKGQDDQWAHWAEFEKIDPEKLYRLRVRYRRIEGDGGVYVGVTHKNADQSRYVTSTNVLATGMGSSNYLVSNHRSPLGEMMEHVFYLKGKSAGAATGRGTIDNPRTFPALAEYYSPMCIANYTSNTGITQFSHIIVEDADSLAASNDANAQAIEMFKTVTREGEASSERTTQLESQVKDVQKHVITTEQQLGETSKKLGQTEIKLGQTDKKLGDAEKRLDANGNLINSQGKRIDEQGNLINAAGKRIDAHGNLIDAQGKRIDENGKRIDDTNKKLTDTEAKVLQVTRTVESHAKALTTFATKSDLEKSEANQTTKIESTFKETIETIRSATDSDSLARDYLLANPKDWESHYGYNMGQYFYTTTTGKVGNTLFRKDSNNPDMCWQYNKAILQNNRAYRVSFLVRRSTNSTGACHITILRSDKNGKFARDYTHLAVPLTEIPANADWVEVSRVVNLRSTAEANPLIRLGFAVGHTGKAGSWEVQGFRVDSVLNETDVDSTLVKSSVLVNYATKSDMNGAISNATTTLTSQYKKYADDKAADGLKYTDNKAANVVKDMDAKLTNNYYTKADTDKAVAGEISKFGATVKRDITAVEANIRKDVYTKAEADEAIASGIQSYDSEIVSGGVNLFTGGILERKGGNEYLAYSRSAALSEIYAKGEVTISFDIKVAVAGPVRVYSSNQSTMWTYSVQIENVTTEWERRSVTVTPRRTSHPVGPSMLEFFGTYNTGRIVHVKNVKIEMGRKASEWSPSAGDIEAGFAGAISEVNKVNANLTNNYFTKAQTNSAIASASTSLEAKVNTNTANQLKNHYTKAETDRVVSTQATTFDAKLKKAGEEANAYAKRYTDTTVKVVDDKLTSTSTDLTQLKSVLGEVTNYTVSSIGGGQSGFGGIKDLAGKVQLQATRGLTLCTFKGNALGDIRRVFDTHASAVNATNLINTINAIPDGTYVAVMGYDSFVAHFATAKPALISLGASKATLDLLKPRDAYILIGRKGMSEGQGTEIVGKAQSATLGGKQIDYMLQLINGIPAGLGSSAPAAEATNILNTKIEEVDGQLKAQSSQMTNLQSSMTSANRNITAAQNTANTAQNNAANAQKSADSAQNAAKGAQSSADAAKKAADTAQQGANAANQGVKDVTSKLSDTDLIARAGTHGKLVWGDPTFRNGVNGVNVYDNKRTGRNKVARIARWTVDNPTTSTHQMNITVSAGSTPGLGGFFQTIASRANAVFLIKYLMKIPVGYTVHNASNAQGTGASDKFVGLNAGTGKYETYYRLVRCGATGTFSTGGHVYLNGPLKGEETMTFPLAQIECYDLTDYQDMTPMVADTFAKLTEMANTSATDSKAMADKLLQLQSSFHPQSPNGRMPQSRDETKKNLWTFILCKLKAGDTASRQFNFQDINTGEIVRKGEVPSATDANNGTWFSEPQTFALFRTWVYVAAAKTVKFTNIRVDDTVTIYVGNQRQYHKVGYGSYTDCSLSFRVGWNVVDVFVGNGNSSGGFVLTPLLETQVNNMCPVKLEDILDNTSASVLQGYTTHAEMNSAIASASTTLESKVKADYQKQFDNIKLDRLTVPDTRNTNQPPQWYWTNYPRSVVTEFKTRTAIGNPAGTAMYGSVETLVPWSDVSGGAIIQRWTTAGEANARFRQSSGSGAAATWGPWTSDAETMKVQIKEQSQSIDGIKGVKAVSIDNNGVLCGYALTSELVNGVVQSAFGVSADQFYVGSPKDGRKVFAVVDGRTVISDAIIGNLSANKITTGQMHGDRITARTLRADHLTTQALEAIAISARNVTITAPDGSKTVQTGGMTQIFYPNG
ncbi:interleukin-like EMT inducer domain-containing protein, partial [Acinetobacter sp. A47]|uniref:interleukin-like EMT inducer domain-containing protein n=1 Tax=Acinetobacter sp. A47 TaxID=1561217 RepID=UPI00069051F9